MQRKYESLRRAYKMEDNDESREIVARRGKEKKYRARRRRVMKCICNYVFRSPLQKFENRSLMTNETEQLHWKQLTIDFMSEESDDETDPMMVVVHQPEWRSKRMLFICTCVQQRGDYILMYCRSY